MTPKEKSEKLVKKYYVLIFNIDNGFHTINHEKRLQTAKKCALFTVENIIQANPIIPLSFMLESEAIDAAVEYWREVEKEIINYLKN